MKKIILFLVVLFTKSINAQQCDARMAENYTSPSANCNLSSALDSPNNNSYCLDIKFHIIRNDDGTGGYDSTQLIAIMDKLNLYFNPYNISLKMKGFDFINNTAIYNHTTSNNAFILNNDSNAINFYLTNIAYGNSQPASGFAFIGQKNLVVQNIHATSSNNTAAHELGHCLGLLHTSASFANYESPCDEAINGTNCTTCGDFVCDTSSILCNGSSTCNYDSTNIMIKVGDNRSHFTEGQGLRMRNTIECYHLGLQSYQCASITGLSSNCINSDNVYSIPTFASATILWSVSSNLQIVGATNTTSVTIHLANNATSGTGVVTLNINGTIITKNIWIGYPIITNHNIHYGNDNVPIGTQSIFTITPANFISSNLTYEWAVVPIGTSCIDNQGNTIPGAVLPYLVDNGAYSKKVFWGNCSGNFRVRCNVSDGFGKAYNSDKVVHVFNPQAGNPCAKNLAITPVPASTQSGKLFLRIALPPNIDPCDNSIFRTSNPNIDTVILYDLNNVEVLNKKFYETDIELDIQNLRNGFYIINTTLDDGEFFTNEVIIE